MLGLDLDFSLIPPQIHNVWLFLILGSLGSMLFSMAKSGFGSSVGLLAVPMMVYACDDNTMLATGIMLPILVASDYLAVICWWRKWRTRSILALLPGALAGVGIGWAILWELVRYDKAHAPVAAATAQAAGAVTQAGGLTAQAAANAGLLVGIGVIAIGFVALQVIGKLRKKPLAFRPVFWQSSVAGAASGVTSTLAHAAGPVAAMYLLSQRMPKEPYVATTAFFFFILNQLKLIPYYSLGMVNTSTLTAGLTMVPAIAAGAVLGTVLDKRVSDRLFGAIVYTLLGVAGVHMVVTGTMKLLGW